MRYLVTCLLFLSGFSLFSQNYSERKINRILSKIEALNKAHVAISIRSLESSKPIVSYQADQYMTPASNTKLLTFLASVESFDSLPALYYHDKDSITHFKSTGYPLLLHPFYPDEELYSFLKGKNYLVYHKPKSNLKPQGPGWSWDDYSYYFASELSPFPIHGNVIQGYGNPNDPIFSPSGFETNPTPDVNATNLKRERFKNSFYYNPTKWNIKDTLYHYDMLDYVEFINQPEALGTGHAIQCCRPYLYQHEYSNTLILSGDVPLIKTETIKNMVKNMEHARIMCTTRENPTGYGRIIEKEGKFEKIVEEKDCNDEERKCRKTNAGIYTFDTITLCKYLPLLSNDNAAVSATKALAIITSCEPPKG